MMQIKTWSVIIFYFQYRRYPVTLRLHTAGLLLINLSKANFNYINKFPEKNFDLFADSIRHTCVGSRSLLYGL